MPHPAHCSYSKGVPTPHHGGDDDDYDAACLLLYHSLPMPVFDIAQQGRFIKEESRGSTPRNQQLSLRFHALPPSYRCLKTHRANPIDCSRLPIALLRLLHFFFPRRFSALPAALRSSTLLTAGVRQVVAAVIDATPRTETGRHTSHG